MNYRKIIQSHNKLFIQQYLDTNVVFGWYANEDYKNICGIDMTQYDYDHTHNTTNTTNDEWLIIMCVYDTIDESIEHIDSIDYRHKKLLNYLHRHGNHMSYYDNNSNNTLSTLLSAYKYAYVNELHICTSIFDFTYLGAICLNNLQFLKYTYRNRLIRIHNDDLYLVYYHFCDDHSVDVYYDVIKYVVNNEVPYMDNLIAKYFSCIYTLHLYAYL